MYAVSGSGALVDKRVGIRDVGAARISIRSVGPMLTSPALPISVSRRGGGRVLGFSEESTVYLSSSNRRGSCGCCASGTTTTIPSKSCVLEPPCG